VINQGNGINEESLKPWSAENRDKIKVL